MRRDAYMRATCEVTPKKKREPIVKSHPVAAIKRENDDLTAEGHTRCIRKEQDHRINQVVALI